MTEKKKTAPTDSPEVLTDAEVIKTTKTDDGLRWHYEDEGDSVRTYVQTKEGRALNVLLPTREAGRAHLRQFLDEEA